MKRMILALMIIVFLPACSAQAPTDDFTIWEYEVTRITHDIPPEENTELQFNITIQDFTSSRTINTDKSVTRLEVFHSSGMQGSSMNTQITWEIDGIPLSDVSSCTTSQTEIIISNGLTNVGGHGESRLVCDMNYTDSDFQIVGEVTTANNIQGGKMGVIVIQTEIINLSTNFEAATGFSALEFMVAPVIAFLGFILWSRSTDSAIRIVGGLLPIIGGLVLFSIGQEVGFGNAWIALIAFMAALMVAGIYMIVRVMLDQFQEASRTK